MALLKKSPIFGRILFFVALNCNRNESQRCSFVGGALQHTATYCNILQHTATYCNTLNEAVERGGVHQHLVCVSTPLVVRASRVTQVVVCVSVCVCHATHSVYSPISGSG